MAAVSVVELPADVPALAARDDAGLVEVLVLVIMAVTLKCY
jgi:hypothetical protein